MAGVAQQAAQPQALHRRHGANERQRVTGVGIDAASVEPDVDLHEDVEDPAGALHRVRPSARHREMIDDDRDDRAIHQRDHTRRIERVDRIGQAHVGDAGVDEHFGLADLRAANAGGAALDLPPGNDGGFVRLRVRPEALTGRRGELLHAVDVALRARAIDHHLRRRKIAQRHRRTLPRLVFHEDARRVSGLVAYRAA